MMVRVFDAEGKARDWAWVQARYGLVNVRKAPEGDAFRLVELRESIGPAVYVVKVVDEYGLPVEGEIVARHWPYREVNAELEELPEGCREWFEHGVYGETNVEGNIGFGSGGGDYYHPENGVMGASSFWVLECPSDCVEGMGVLGGTEHAHLDMAVAWVAGEEPEPPPPDPDIEKAKSKIMEAKALLDEALELLGE